MNKRIIKNMLLFYFIKVNIFYVLKIIFSLLKIISRNLKCIFFIFKKNLIHSLSDYNFGL